MMDGLSYDEKLYSGSSTPVMKAIKEEDISASPEKLYNTPPSKDPNKSFTSINEDIPVQPRPLFTSPTYSRPNSAFYASKEGNNSSSSIIYNPTFTFGDTETAGSVAISASETPKNGNIFNPGTVTPPRQPCSPATLGEERRQSLKYIPNPQLAPPTSRSRSPVRSHSPDHTSTRNKRSSLIFETPFTLGSAGTTNQNTPPSSATRTSFRKGHRYKHSSVSMNFFQEPEIKIPLNIAKSLPIPDFHDLMQNLVWPKAHFQFLLTILQIILCLAIFQLGHSKEWTNFTTLSHFITYDILGSVAIILVENLSQFEVWSTGTLTFPLGLNRIDVLISFALAVSLCFVGLDLLFHIAEEFIVSLVESNNHEEIATNIPHSHHSKSGSTLSLFSSPNDFKLWYVTLFINLILSSLTLYKIFYTNKNSRLKTKNPIITITYTIYLFFYPIFNTLSGACDYISIFVLAIFILAHGLTIAQWTSTIILMGFSTTALPASTLLHDPRNDKIKHEQESEQKITTIVRNKSINSLPVAIKKKSKTGQLSNLKLNNSNNNNISTTGRFSSFSFWRKQLSSNEECSILKSVLKDQIESIQDFQNKCYIDYDRMMICKVNFDLYIVLIKLALSGGSNEDELKLRLAIEKLINKLLTTSETTIEIDRI